MIVFHYMSILLFTHHCILGYLDGLVNIFSHIFNFFFKLVSRIGIWHQKVCIFLYFWFILPCCTERVNISASAIQGIISPKNKYYISETPTHVPVGFENILMNTLSGCFLSPKPSLIQDMIFKKISCKYSWTLNSVGTGLLW